LITAFLPLQVVLLVLEVHARIAEESHHFRHLVSYLIRTFHNNHVLLERYVHIPNLELILNFIHEFCGLGLILQYIVNGLPNKWFIAYCTGVAL
jgi:hypothetical protein